MSLCRRIPSCRRRVINTINVKTAYLYLIVTTTVWGSIFVVTRIALKTIPPITLLLSRYLLASLVLWLLVFILKKNIRVNRKDVKYFFFIGIFGYFIGVAVQFFGTRFAGAGIASMINATNPIFIAGFATLLLKEKVSFGKIASIILALIGVYIILYGSQAVELKIGALISVVATLFWAFSSVIVRKISHAYDPIVITAYGILIATICAIPASGIELMTTPHPGMFTLSNCECVLYLGLIATVLPNLLWNKSLSILEASTCALFYPIQPFVSILLGVLFLHESISIHFWIGSLLIVCGIFFSLLLEKRKQVPTAEL